MPKAVIFNIACNTYKTAINNCRVFSKLPFLSMINSVKVRWKMLVDLYTNHFWSKQWKNDYLTFHIVIMPSVLWRCRLGGRKGIRPEKNEWWGAGVVISVERGADLYMAQLMPLPLTVSCFSKIQIGFTFWYRHTRVVPDKGPLNGCVCVCYENNIN